MNKRYEYLLKVLEKLYQYMEKNKTRSPIYKSGLWLYLYVKGKTIKLLEKNAEYLGFRDKERC